jgi:hypothetical protein
MNNTFTQEETIRLTKEIRKTLTPGWRVAHEWCVDYQDGVPIRRFHLGLKRKVGDKMYVKLYLRGDGWHCTYPGCYDDVNDVGKTSPTAQQAVAAAIKKITAKRDDLNKLIDALTAKD